MEGISCIQEHDSTPLSKDSQPQDDGASRVDLSNSKLTADQQQALKDLLKKYRDVFALTPDELGRTGIIKYTIDTGDSAPIPHGLTASQNPKKLQSTSILMTC